MYKRVLIVDDHDAILHSITKVLHSYKISQIDSVQYCDDAFLKYKRALLDGNAYDLIITDLCFKKDYRNTHLASGEDLIEAIRATDKGISIIVYSMNDQLQKVRYLVKSCAVNGFVCKDRRGSLELTSALMDTSKGVTYLSPQIVDAMSRKEDLEILDYDITLLKLLSQGKSQEEISHHFKTRAIKPSSLSSIEKRLNRLRIQFKAENAIHLVSQAKDLGLI
ncbi:response regulator [Winogradskyella aurantiaca]|uniref:response regulator n=1 Tax=Winogradskyella aurantiaca TaxID=2219558 RepID=UPI000E1DA97E|nr:response regulator [Winogradskyella aurantiaca]